MPRTNGDCGGCWRMRVCGRCGFGLILRGRRRCCSKSDKRAAGFIPAETRQIAILLRASKGDYAMRWIAALIVGLSLALPAFAQENEAEKLYRAFEKTIAKAKAFSVTFDASGHGSLAAKGKLTIAAGNRLD